MVDDFKGQGKQLAVFLRYSWWSYDLESGLHDTTRFHYRTMV